VSAFDTVLADVFVYGAEERLDKETERAAIRDAQLGDEAATIALIRAYAPVLRSLVSRHGARIGVEDARMTAVSGLIEAIHAFDLDAYDGQLAGIASHRVSNALREVESTAIAVPERTVRRYLGILRDAGGDANAAAELAESRGMTRAAFLAVRDAFTANHLDEEPMHLDRSTPVWAPAESDAFADADDRAMTDVALAACTGTQREVVMFAYGFRTGDPMSDGEVAEAMSVHSLGEEAVSAGQSVISRASVQRQRAKAIVVMQSALGVA
jgi:DNA-directed RNA polymerase specialized sigma subunit